jgi:hypothetical protein
VLLYINKIIKNSVTPRDTETGGPARSLLKSKSLVAFFRISKNKETNIAQVGSLKAGVKTALKSQQKTKLRPFKSKK